MSSQDKTNRPRWVMSLRDLEPKRDKGTYELDGETQIVVSKRWREMLETLRVGPVYCASPVRLSDAVCVLRREYGVAIETQTTDQGRKFYALDCDVREVV